MRPRLAGTILAAGPLLLLLTAVGGCDRSTASSGSASPSGKLQVVAAENVWGSIAAQLGGTKVDVQSILVNPDTDPHSYQPSAQDARAIAGSEMTIVNGLGYDEWASQLLRSSESAGRVVLDVGETLGLAGGANPHRWYFPGDLRTVIRGIVADYEHLDPAGSAYFEQRRRDFETVGLARYEHLRQEIRARYGGVTVGYSESVFQGLGEDLGLSLQTPYSFVKAIAEGTDVTAAEKQRVDTEAAQHKIRVWVYNSQNVTPDVQRVNQIARAQHIPITTVTETLSPATASFQRWQVDQLEALRRALHEATGR